MKKANGPNVIQKPMSEHEPYRWKRVTKVAYQQERFKRNAKKVNKFFNSFFIFSLSGVFFCMCVFVRMLWLCEVGWGKVVKFFSCFSSSSPSVWSKSNFQVQVKYFLFSSSRLTFFFTVSFVASQIHHHPLEMFSVKNIWGQISKQCNRESYLPIHSDSAKSSRPSAFSFHSISMMSAGFVHCCWWIFIFFIPSFHRIIKQHAQLTRVIALKCAVDMPTIEWDDHQSMK